MRQRDGQNINLIELTDMDWVNRRHMIYGIYSPYSAETTEYLAREYPEYWTDIREFGLLNPNYVPYIDEDPDVICSLLYCGYRRWLDDDGTKYIKTGVLTSSELELEWGMKLRTLGGFGIGARVTSSNSSLNQTFGDEGLFWVTFGNNSETTFGTVQTDVLYSFLQNKDIFSVNGESHIYRSGYSPIFNSPLELYLFSRNNNGAADPSGTFNGLCLSVTIRSAGVDIRRFVPFKTGRNRDQHECYPAIGQPAGSIGMLDFLTGIFYPNVTNTGSFGIIKTAF